MTSEGTGAPNDHREGQVLDAVVTLVDSLMHDFDLVELLTDLSERSVRLLDVSSAGLLLADPSHRLHLMTATTEETRHVELFQLQAEQGPCLECYATGEPVSVADLANERDRWPRFVTAATEAGFASVHALPLRAAGLVLGALGLFGTRVGDLNPADQAVGQALAHIATVAIVQEHAPTPWVVMPQVRNALIGRTVVEQAKGYLRGHFGVSVDDAFVLLRRYSSDNGQHLTDVSRALIFDEARRAEILDAIAQLTMAASRDTGREGESRNVTDEG
ncbi:GAF and ANTAR domain-containing protein [Jatrophihabitans telluris]|uniref:GAF and ANTAR domain-containing protein n=1 Tax=Jatrophihabitans telluris TaxID=2038343 RepID=A0ABY4R1V7_9ACTN|nr:GAF and ANTAR domain-containing protein [Jatrophihabitans telluris]UQX89019.1 GAF and ANTAR domain-containing protein [Jatrophihabitans telluris]